MSRHHEYLHIMSQAVLAEEFNELVESFGYDGRELDDPYIDSEEAIQILTDWMNEEANLRKL